jgi:hypothetical protein
MRYLLAALLAMFLLSACETMDAEDKTFFYTGWMHPQKAADERLQLR